MFYYLYQITNTVNNKIYVGVHMTNDINDGYMGSGKVIKRAIEKHGIDNFHKDILEFFENAETMYAKEKEVVTDEFLLREDVYNLRRGGSGGFDYLNKTKLNLSGHHKSYDIRCKTLKEAASKGGKSCYANNGINANFAEAAKVSFKGKTHTDEAKKKIGETNSKRQSGEYNSQFGTMWITNGIQNKKISKTDDIPEGWDRGRACNGR